MKYKIFIFLIIILLPLANAIKLGLTPSQVYFMGNSGEKICNNLSIYSDKDVNVITYVKWSNNKSVNINDFYFNSNYYKISEEFQKNIILVKNKKETQEICLVFKDEGKYNGVYIVSSENRNVAVGSWIFTNIKKKSDNKTKIIFFGGLSIVDLIIILSFLLTIEKKYYY